MVDRKSEMETKSNKARALWAQPRAIILTGVAAIKLTPARSYSTAMKYESKAGTVYFFSKACFMTVRDI
jgi:hypothetical protein